MGEHTSQLSFDNRRASGTRPRKRTAEEFGRRLLSIIVYDKGYRIGGMLTVDDLDTTEIGDWKMSDYKAACAHAASHGWLIIENETLTLTPAGLAAA